VRLRTKVTKGAGSAAAALAVVLKLVESAQARWRSVNAPHLVALVRERPSVGDVTEHAGWPL
jgi:putative transposase